LENFFFAGETLDFLVVKSRINRRFKDGIFKLFFRFKPLFFLAYARCVEFFARAPTAVREGALRRPLESPGRPGTGLVQPLVWHATCTGAGDRGRRLAPAEAAPGHTRTLRSVPL